MMPTNATVTEEVVVHDEALQRDLVRDAVKVSWSSILAGLVVALGAWVLLSVLGLALGLSQADPGNPASLKSAGLITGIWSVVVPIVALLLGGLVAARTAGVVTRPTGAIHGVVLWALMMIASLALVGFVVKGVTSAAMGGGRGLASMDATAAPDLGRTFAIDAQEVVGPVNDRLAAEGRPPVTPRELRATMRDIAGSATLDGHIEHGFVLAAVLRNTHLVQGDADELANRIEEQLNQSPVQLPPSMPSNAVSVADRTGHAMWWVFLGMVLGLGAAVLGSTLGVSRRQRLAASPTPAEAYVTHHPAHST
jgi:hypothetical protein